MEAGTKAPNPQPAANHQSKAPNSLECLSGWSFFGLRTRCAGASSGYSFIFPQTPVAFALPSHHSSRLVLATVQNLVDEARLHDQSVVSISAVNASKQRTRPTGGICMTQSRIESDSFFAMSIMSQKLLMPISVNLGNKKARAPTKP
jgi:hypothetical protein